MGNIIITWQRRDRHSASIASAFGNEASYPKRDAENPPLSEDFEQYIIRIMSASTGATVLRSQTVNSSSYSYPASNQTADFGGVRTSLTVKVAQVSSSFGNGSFATATLYPLFNEPAPRISGFTPASANVGATITLSGTSLAQLQQVKIGEEIQLNLAVIDNQTISFVIAPETISDRIQVTTTGGSVLRAYPLIIT